MLALLLALAAPQAATAPTLNPAPAAQSWPTREDDFHLKDFRFASGETLPDLRVHYTTLGTPHRDAKGQVDNAVLLLHGTGGTGKQFLAPQFATELFGPGQPLDIATHFIVMPDGIGHGGSSKPSDGLRMKFPRYDYADMVAAHYRLLTERLGVAHPRLILGTSMGCMHIFVLAEAHPGFARALMPLACQPVELAGSNRMWRQLAIDGIKADPTWNGGNYTAQPLLGLRTAQSLLTVMGFAQLNLQAAYPKRADAAAFVRARLDTALKNAEANDLIYQIDASRTYDPWPNLEKITTPVTWLNSSDDLINPPGLDFPERAAKRMPDARFRMIPGSARTRGHGTHTAAEFWKADLIDLLRRTER